MKREAADELQAAAIIAQVTGCDTKWFDRGSDGKPQPDYELLDTGGTEIGFIEVTSATSEDWESFWIPSTSKHRVRCGINLVRNWTIYVDSFSLKETDLRELGKVAPQVLIDFEYDTTSFEHAT